MEKENHLALKNITRYLALSASSSIALHGSHTLQEIMSFVKGSTEEVKYLLKEKRIDVNSDYQVLFD